MSGGNYPPSYHLQSHAQGYIHPRHRLPMLPPHRPSYTGQSLSQAHMGQPALWGNKHGYPSGYHEPSATYYPPSAPRGYPPTSRSHFPSEQVPRWAVDPNYINPPAVSNNPYVPLEKLEDRFMKGMQQESMDLSSHVYGSSNTQIKLAPPAHLSNVTSRADINGEVSRRTAVLKNPHKNVPITDKVVSKANVVESPSNKDTVSVIAENPLREKSEEMDKNYSTSKDGLLKKSNEMITSFDFRLTQQNEAITEDITCKRVERTVDNDNKLSQEFSSKYDVPAKQNLSRWDNTLIPKQSTVRHDNSKNILQKSADDVKQSGIKFDVVTGCRPTVTKVNTDFVAEPDGTNISKISDSENGTINKSLEIKGSEDHVESILETMFQTSSANSSVPLQSSVIVSTQSQKPSSPASSDVKAESVENMLKSPSPERSNESDNEVLKDESLDTSGDEFSRLHSTYDDEDDEKTSADDNSASLEESRIIDSPSVPRIELVSKNSSNTTSESSTIANDNGKSVDDAKDEFRKSPVHYDKVKSSELPDFSGSENDTKFRKVQGCPFPNEDNATVGFIDKLGETNDNDGKANKDMEKVELMSIERIDLGDADGSGVLVVDESRLDVSSNIVTPLVGKIDEKQNEEIRMDVDNVDEEPIGKEEECCVSKKTAATEKDTFVKVETELEKLFAGIVDTSAENNSSIENDDSNQPNMKQNSKASDPILSNMTSTPLVSKKPNKKKASKRPNNNMKKKDIKEKPKAIQKENLTENISKFRVPIIRIEGSKENPHSVTIINNAQKHEEEDASEGSNKRKLKTAFKIDHNKKLASSYNICKNYDPESSDESWVCIFCKLGPHCPGTAGDATGDLFGPYFITTTAVNTSNDSKHRRGSRQLNSSKTKKRAVSLENGGVNGIPCQKQLEIWGHENCFIWASGIHLIGSNLVGIEESVNIALSTKCIHCGEFGASIGCQARHCKSCIHYSCGLYLGWILDKSTFTTICNVHRVLD